MPGILYSSPGITRPGTCALVPLLIAGGRCPEGHWRAGTICSPKDPSVEPRLKQHYIPQTYRIAPTRARPCHPHMDLLSGYLQALGACTYGYHTGTQTRDAEQSLNQAHDTARHMPPCLHSLQKTHGARICCVASPRKFTQFTSGHGGGSQHVGWCDVTTI